MYELSGPPFKHVGGGSPNLRDRSGEQIKLMGDSHAILHDLATSPEWAETEVTVEEGHGEPD